MESERMPVKKGLSFINAITGILQDSRLLNIEGRNQIEGELPKQERRNNS